MKKELMKQHTLDSYPILHNFLAQLYKLCDVYVTDDMLEYIKDDYINQYCRCSDKTCSTVYICSDRIPVFEDGEQVYIEAYNSNKGLIVLHFYDNGDIEIEALEYSEYPFKDEVKYVFNNKAYDCSQEKAKNIVDNYFSNINKKELSTIIVD